MKGEWQLLSMNAEILAVGTELLMGQIANTNAQYISSKLPNAGINVYYHSVVGDNPMRLKKSLDIALKRSDVVIITGGLGPTQDDITKETVSQVLGLKLMLHNEVLEKIKSYFQKLNRPMSHNNIKQAITVAIKVTLINVLTAFHPSSSSPLPRYPERTGISAADTAPPTSRLYIRSGTKNAILYMSAISLTPNLVGISISLINPVILLTTTEDITIAAAEVRFFLCILLKFFLLILINNTKM
jgi:molybdenum cofactor synthesis domain-containing protein